MLAVVVVWWTHVQSGRASRWSSLPSRPQQLGASESRAYEDIIRWCSDSVRTRGVLVKSFFLDFDKHKNGTVSATQFGRAVRICFPLLSDGDVEVLTKRYAVGSDVNYRAFHVDVTPGAGLASVGGGICRGWGWHL